MWKFFKTDDDASQKFEALAEKYLDELEKGHDVVMEEHRIVTVWKDAVKLNVQGASKSTAKCMAVFEQLQSRKISEPEARVKISECKAATSEMAGVLAKLLKNLSPSLERLKSALQRFNQVNDNIGLYCAKLRREARYKKWWRNVLGVLCFLSALASVVSLVFPIVSPLFMTGTVALAIASGVASAGPILGYATVASERHMKILHAAATARLAKANSIPSVHLVREDLEAWHTKMNSAVVLVGESWRSVNAVMEEWSVHSFFFSLRSYFTFGSRVSEPAHPLKILRTASENFKTIAKGMKAKNL